MTLYRRLFALWIGVFSTAAFAQDVAKSWEKGIAYHPGSPASPQALDQLPADKAYPVVVFMHGCDGLVDGRSDSHAWGKMLASQGMLVIMPDSLARIDRQASCDPGSGRFGLFPAVHAMRLDELRYATEQVRTQPWFDGKNLILMGFSEGAVAAVRTRLPGFGGVIATGWSCTHTKFPGMDGVFLAPDIPLLTISHEDDVVVSSEQNKGSCANKIAGRAKAMHLAVPGKGHGTYHHAPAREAVARFLKDVIQPM